MTVAIGYVRVGDNRIEEDPDQRIQEAIGLVFSKFAEMQSVRQVHLWFRHERLPLPAIIYGEEGRLIEWKLPIPYEGVQQKHPCCVIGGATLKNRTAPPVRACCGRSCPGSSTGR